MKENEIEKLAFLYVCGERDREILLGGRNMEFQDFCRLHYLVEILGLEQLNLELWKQFARNFKEQIEKNEQDRKNGILMIEEEMEQREFWIRDFLKGIPDKESKKFCEEAIGRVNSIGAY